MKPKLKINGFTLVELLVVISIIALLLSILLPSLNRARSLARRVVCSSQMHSSMLGILTWATDNNNKLPPTARTSQRQGNLASAAFTALGNTGKRSEFGDTAQQISKYTGTKPWFCPGNKTHPVGSNSSVSNEDAFRNSTWSRGKYWMGLTHYVLYWGQALAEPDASSWKFMPIDTTNRGNGLLFGDMMGYTMNITFQTSSGASIVNHYMPQKRYKNIPGGNFMTLDGSVKWYRMQFDWSRFTWMEDYTEIGKVYFTPLTGSCR